MGLSVEEVKSKALAEIEPRIIPVKNFINFVKESIVGGIDTLDQDTLGHWMFVIPTMYGELRCIEAECLLAADLMDSEIDKVKADAINAKGDLKVTDARAMAASATHDAQVKQQVAKFMSKYVAGYHSQLDMLILSVRALFGSRTGGVKNNV